MSSELSAALDSLPREDGVSMARAPGSRAEEPLYLAVRRAEHRIYSDSELRQLPYLKDHQHAGEWKLRARTFKRLHAYLARRGPGVLLDLGCGNGWLVGRLTDLGTLSLVGIDLNMMELKQAARVFANQRVIFVYGDVLADELPPGCFDYITLGASVQYFPDLGTLLQRLLRLLADDGEIHIFDSPFYAEAEIEAATRRSLSYYAALGFPQMADHYFHHGLSQLDPFQPELLYRPGRRSLLQRLSGAHDNPFPWVRIRKRAVGGPDGT